MITKQVQNAPAGTPFNGTTGRGLFSWPNDRDGIIIKSITLDMGNEAGKSWTITIVGTSGDQTLLESGSGTTANVALVGDIPLGYGDTIVVVTLLATNEAFCSIAYEDQKSNSN